MLIFPGAEKKKNAGAPAAKGSLAVFIAIIVIALGVVAASVMTIRSGERPPVFSLSADGGFFTIDSMYGETIDTAAIRRVELKPYLPDHLERTNGYGGAGSVVKGFCSSDIGDVRVFVDMSKSLFLYITTATEVIILNGEGDDQTTQLFDMLNSILQNRGAETMTSASPDASPSPETPPSAEPSVVVRPPLDETAIDTTASEIDISEKTFASFDFLEKCKNLKKLSIENCVLPDGETLPRISGLETLCVDWCGPSAVTVIKNNTQVRTLSLGGDQLTDISGLKTFTSLRELHLLGNDVKDLTPLRAMRSLELLDLLDGNYNMTSLEPLFSLRKLSKIYMNLKTYQNIAPDDLRHFGADPDAETPGSAIIEID